MEEAYALEGVAPKLLSCLRPATRPQSRLNFLGILLRHFEGSLIADVQVCSFVASLTPFPQARHPLGVWSPIGTPVLRRALGLGRLLFHPLRSEAKASQCLVCGSAAPTGIYQAKRLESPAPPKFGGA